MAAKTDVKVELVDKRPFNVIAMTKKALIREGLDDVAEEFVEEAQKKRSYNKLLKLVQQFVVIEKGGH